MSNTLIYAVKQDEEPIFIGETRNAFRGAMYVWSDIANRYFGLKGFPHFDERMQRRVWNAQNEKPLTESEIIVLASTMDKALVKKKGIKKLLHAFKEYGFNHENSSIGEQGELIASSIEKIPNGYALAWNQTSVNDLWFAEWHEDEKYICNIGDSFDVIEQMEESV